nr:hypothetical protein [Tanacetum cinerariifolium]
MCEEFKEFNYLLKIDLDLLTKDIKGFKTYEEFKNDWIYEWNNDVPWVHERPWTIMEHGMNPHQLNILANLLIKKLDVQSGLHVAREKMDTIDHEVDEIPEICSNETHELPVYNIRRFEMIKYSFGDDEEYVVVKEDEYDDLTRRYGVSVPALTKDYGNKIQYAVSRRRQYVVFKLYGNKIFWKISNVVPTPRNPQYV